MSRKITSLALALIIVLGLFAAMPVTARAASDNDNIDIAELVDDIGIYTKWSYDHASRTITVTDDVNVIGTVTDATNKLKFVVPDTITVTWKANYSSAAGFTPLSLIEIDGKGTFDVADGTIISSKEAIRDVFTVIGNEATISVRGGAVSATGSYSAIVGGDIEVSGGAVSAASTHAIAAAFGPGRARITGGIISSTGAHAATVKASTATLTGGTVSATAGTAIDANGVAIESGSPVIIGNDSGANPAIKVNMGSLHVDAGNLTVNGNIEAATIGVEAVNGASVTVNGNITAGNTGVYALSSSVVTVNGSVSVTGDYAYGVFVGSGSVVTVNGSVNATGEYEVYGVQINIGHPEGTTKATVTGNVSASGYGATGVRCGGYDFPAEVFVGGNVTATGEGSTGVAAFDFGQVTVDGTVSGEGYRIIIVEWGPEKDAASLKPGYDQYSDGYDEPRTFVWVKIPGSGQHENPIVIPDPDTPLGGLETDKHIVYLYGYPDGAVRTDSPITRAEAASVFYRLLKAPGTSTGGKFSDVKDGAWYAQAINYLASVGIVTGYPDGTFKPGNAITRAEFAAMASRFDELASTGSNAFSDVLSSHWAASYINSAYAKGWVNGYPDGTFKPENGITRAEVVTIVNAMLNRKIDSEALARIANPYNDIAKTHWSYADIIEASVAHDYERDGSGVEIWQP